MYMPVLTFAMGYSVISHGQRPYPRIISCGLGLFLVQGFSISTQPKKALVRVGCTCFASPVGVRLGAYSDH